MLGNGRLEAQCFDGERRLAHIRGKMRKKVRFGTSLQRGTPTHVDGSGQVWINQGDIILLSLRDFQDDKADVIVKYTADEARNLKVCFLCVSERPLSDRNVSRPTVNCLKMPRSTRIPLVKMMRVARSSLRMMAKSTLTTFDGFLTMSSP
jgi:translation initiation factor IF-1